VFHQKKLRNAMRIRFKKADDYRSEFHLIIKINYSQMNIYTENLIFRQQKRPICKKMTEKKNFFCISVCIYDKIHTFAL